MAKVWVKGFTKDDGTKVKGHWRYNAVASSGTKRIQENLDSFDELQRFMNRIEKRGFTSAVVTGKNTFGKTRVMGYSWDGTKWAKVKPALLKLKRSANT